MQNLWTNSFKFQMKFWSQRLILIIKSKYDYLILQTEKPSGIETNLFIILKPDCTLVFIITNNYFKNFGSELSFM